MDYARKIGKSDKPKEWVKQLPGTVSTYDSLISRDRSIVEDRRLVNWKKWLEDRKQQQEFIEAYTDRHSNLQIMNACETIRPRVEMKNLMYYANIPVPVVPDKYRGGPEFWRVPQRLRNRDDCLPDVTFTPSKKELNMAPELMYVALPEIIKKEKGLDGLRPKEPSRKRSEYLMKRKQKLKKEIELLVSKEPEMSNLAIKGHNSPEKRKPEPRIPPITIYSPEEQDCKDSQDYPDQAVVLKIEDTEIVWQRSSMNEQTESVPIRWNVSLASTVNSRKERDIVFENKGNRVIVYEWRQMVFESKLLPLKRRLSPFFFHKTKEVIPPGQIVKFKVWYLPRIAGVFSESWRLLTNPKLCPSPLVFRFWGCARVRNADTIKCNPVFRVDQYLDRCVRDTIIVDIVNDIMEGVHNSKPQEPAYGSLFLESEIFLIKNPLCFYHPSIAMEFHKIYQAVINDKEERWNLSLDDLRKFLLNIKQPDRRHNMLTQFSQLYKECLRPTLDEPLGFNKYEAVRNILCSFFNQFETENNFAKGACFAKKCESVGSIQEADIASMKSTKSITVSQISSKSSNARSKRERKSKLSLNHQSSEVIGSFDLITNERLHCEIFYIRIYQLLSDTVERILATIDSLNNLSESDK